MKNQKALVAYFSRPDENYGVGQVEVGNTEFLARAIVTGLRATEFKIQPLLPYPADYQEATEVAKEEREKAARPAYAGEIDTEPYEVVFLGYPVWWGDLPMVVYSFLDRHEWDGKVIIPFCTHEGSGGAGTYQKLKEYLPEATVVLSGLDVLGKVARTEEGQRLVEPWLESLGFED